MRPYRGRDDHCINCWAGQDLSDIGCGVHHGIALPDAVEAFLTEVGDRHHASAWYLSEVANQVWPPVAIAHHSHSDRRDLALLECCWSCLEPPFEDRPRSHQSC